jgi:hypothetical protein
MRKLVLDIGDVGDVIYWLYVSGHKMSGMSRKSKLSGMPWMSRTSRSRGRPAVSTSDVSDVGNLGCQ